ncbi:MAG TPA: head-tail connector protein [Micropepsaceae bacterium]|nr:head-tail connector protein [Micropepsaceae bacterium]
MGLELLTPPASEPVSLVEAKAHLRVDHDDEDAAIARLITAARESCERITNRAFIAQSWRLWCDAWPDCVPRVISIPKPPLMSLTSVVAYDRSGAATMLSSDVIIVDSAAVPGRLVLADTAVLPVDLRQANAIAVSFQAGYGANASDVPAAIRMAILSLIAHLYEARGESAVPPPNAVAQLGPFRVIML